MKNKIIQEIPNWSDMKPKSAEFDTLAELLAIDWVKDSSEDFHRWSLGENRLMLEKDGGKWWWVVGYIARPDLLDLPKWVAVRDEKKVDIDYSKTKITLGGVELTGIASGESVRISPRGEKRD